MAMSLPLISCIRLSEVSSKFCPSKRISPSGYSAGGSGLSCIMERAVTLFPPPDSPTIPNVSPASSEKETPSTALTVPSWVLKWVLRLFTSSIATGYASLSEWPFLREEYSSDGARASPALLPLPFHVIEDRPVEIAAPLLALFEVLGANVRAESIEERAVFRIRTLQVPGAAQGDGDHVFRSGLAEIQGVQVPDTDQLAYRFRMVIHAQVHDPVVVPPASPSLTHDEQRRRLLPPQVPTCLLPGIQRREQPRGEVSLRLLVGPRQRLDRLLAEEDVALGRVVLPGQAPGPVEASCSGEGRRPSPAIDDPDLPVIAVFIV